MILKAKESIISDFETNAPASRKRIRNAQYQDVDDVVYEWYILAREWLVPVTGPMLQEEALVIANGLGHSEFKASNSWLQRFKDRHNIKQLVVSGEAGDVAVEMIEAWQERLKILVQGYAPEDIWNEDETGCFFRALPERSLADAKKDCRGGKKSKMCIILLFLVNAAGDKEMPIVIGRAASPRCFNGVKDKKKPLGIPYYSNAKAWMDSVIMSDIVTKLNRNLPERREMCCCFWIM